MSALDLLDEFISELEGKLGLSPGEALPSESKAGAGAGSAKKGKKEKKKKAPQQEQRKGAGKSEPNHEQPEINKLDLKVGVITKAWIHPTADKLYCEEIDIGEESGPRQIASGLRAHYSLEEMNATPKVVVVANLKAKNLVGFKSHGMILCASSADDSTVRFVTPPEDAVPGDVIVCEGLDKPEPLSAAQTDKKKIFIKCMDGMKTDKDGMPVWEGHKMMVDGKGLCTAGGILDGVLR